MKEVEDNENKMKNTLMLHYNIVIDFKTLTQDFKPIYFVSKSKS